MKTIDTVPLNLGEIKAEVGQMNATGDLCVEVQQPTGVANPNLIANSTFRLGHSRWLRPDGTRYLYCGIEPVEPVVTITVQERIAAKKAKKAA